MFKNIFKNKNVIITGHTGFKGSWLTVWLLMLGANVTGISLEPKKVSHFNLLNIKKNLRNNYYVDIRNVKKLEKIFIQTKPDFVFHLAAQAIVKKSYQDPRLTWETNVIGTLNVIEAIKKTNRTCVAIMITSDKCYYNKEILRGYREDDELGGKDPYSASKASAEHVIHSYYKSYFETKSKIKLCSVRAGNVIGGGDWSDDRIIPDCIKSWIKKEEVLIKNPYSTRPWQHVLEPLSGYLNLASMMKNKKILNGEKFNFGPNQNQNKTVLDLVKKMSQYFSESEWVIKKNNASIKESNLLKLNCIKAKNLLHWEPTLNFHDTAKFTSEWYKAYQSKKNIYQITSQQIKDYYVRAKRKKLKWTK